MALAIAASLAVTAPQVRADPQPEILHFGAFMDLMPTVEASVRGGAGTFLFDMGGGMSDLSPRLAKATGCTPWGNIVGFRMRGDRLDLPHCDDVEFVIGKRRFIAPQAAVFDMNSIAPKNAPPLDGLVALDLFADQAITVETAARKLTIETPASLAKRTRHLREQRIRIVRDAEGVALTVNLGVPSAKGMLWMEMDSGNDDSAIPISKSSAAALGLDPEVTTSQPIHVELGPGLVIDGRAHVVDKLIMDGNIPLKFLQSWAITLDIKHGRAWLAPVDSGAT